MPDRFERILSDPPPAAGNRAHLLAQRAERLARLGRRRPGAGQTGADNPEAALESFIAALAGAVAPAPERAPRAEILPFARSPEKTPGGPAETAAAGGSGLDLLPGAGPGLTAALVQAGIPDLAALAAATPEDLGPRLGPLGRLINLAAWIAFARSETGRDRTGRD
jgi:predicted flap endonuclease-1-like 5' DNA nuclease